MLGLCDAAAVALSVGNDRLAEWMFRTQFCCRCRIQNILKRGAGNGHNGLNRGRPKVSVPVLSSTKVSTLPSVSK